MSWRRTIETSSRRSIETSLGVSFETYLRRHWDVQRDVAATSPRRLNAGWDISATFHTISKINLRNFVRSFVKKTLILSQFLIKYAVFLKIFYIIFLKESFGYFQMNILTDFIPPKAKFSVAISEFISEKLYIK